MLLLLVISFLDILYPCVSLKCLNKPKGLLGTLILDPWIEPEDDLFSKVLKGGKYKPQECEARQKVAIVIPFRDRDDHLKKLVQHLHPILQRQQLEYQIFVIEQLDPEEFNRGSLMNVGYKIALKHNEFNCFVFHDVDLLPEDDRIMYNCNEKQAKHLSVAIDRHKYRIIYEKNFGGVTALTKEQFKKSNGFSNNFYGWGGEDDDLYRRVVIAHGYQIFRYPANIARYKMLKHDRVEGNEIRDELLKEGNKRDIDYEGLSTLEFKIIKQNYHKLYSWFLVSLPNNPNHGEKTNKSSESFLNSFLNTINDLMAKPSQQTIKDVVY